MSNPKYCICDDYTQIGRVLTQTLGSFFVGLLSLLFHAEVLALPIALAGAALPLACSSRLLYAVRNARIIGILYFGGIGTALVASYGWFFLHPWFSQYLLAGLGVYALAVLFYLYKRQYAYPTY